MFFVFIVFATSCALHQVAEKPEGSSGLVLINNDSSTAEIQCIAEYHLYDPEYTGVNYRSVYYDEHSRLQIYMKVAHGETKSLNLPGSWPLTRDWFSTGIGYLEAACLGKKQRRVQNYYIFGQADFPYSGVLFCELRDQELACQIE